MAPVLRREGRVRDHDLEPAVVLPNGCFTRRGAEQLVRKDLIDADLVEAVVQLPKDMFFGAGIPACWLVLNRSKDERRQGQVIFIDASGLFERVDTKNRLRSSDIDQIVNAFVADEPEEGFSTFLTVPEVIEGNYNLSVRRFVRGTASDDDEALDLDEALATYSAARAARQEAEEELAERLAELESAL